MTARIPKYSKEEHARRGTHAYETRVRSQVETGGRGKIVAIDVDSDDFEVGTNVVVLAPDVAMAFPDADSVNEALRALMKIARNKGKTASI